MNGKKINLFEIIFRWFLFILIFFSIAQSMEPLFETTSRRLLYHFVNDRIVSQEYDYDVLLIGASHIERATNPFLLETLLHKKCGILYYSAADIRSSYFALRDAVEHDKVPKIVVLDGFTITSKSPVGYNGLSLYNRLMVIKDTITFFPPENHIENMGIIFRNHANWKYTENFKAVYSVYNDYYLHTPSKEKLDGLWEGYYDFPNNVFAQTASIIQYDQEEQMPYADFDEYTEHQLLRLKYYCDSLGIKLIIINIPTLNPSSVDLIALEEFSQMNGIPFFDLDASFRNQYEDKHVLFSEGGHNSHINGNGQMLFVSNYLAPLLADELNLEINNDEVDEITNLVQTSLTTQTQKDINGEEFIEFKLMPMHLEEKLIYSWTLYKDDTIVISSQTSEKNTFMIHQAYWDNDAYKIVVKITDPQRENKSLELAIPCQ